MNASASISPSTPTPRRRARVLVEPKANSLPHLRRPKPVPDDETPNDRFHRLAVARVNKVLKDMKAVARLSSSRYHWTDAQAQAVIVAILNEADQIRTAFSRKDSTEPFNF